LDLAYASLRFGRQRLGMFAGQLSSETVTTADGRATRAKRYLYGHRLDLFFGRWRLGLDELALAAGPGESLSLRYLNPLQIYAQLQAEDNGDDPSQVNVLTSFDSDVRLGPVRLFGSFLLDDLQIDAEGRDRKPDQLGWSVGAGFGPTVSSPWWVGYVYRRLDTWTFLHGDDGTSLRQFERPLGAPEGPDGDRHHLHVSRRLSSRWRLSLEGEHRRRGENRITTGDTASGHAGEPFPSGRVESRWIASAGLQASLPPFAEAFLTASYHDIKNVNNTSSDENVLEVRLEMRLRGPAVSWRIREEDAD
jgi:hypothetical protein